MNNKQLFEQSAGKILSANQLEGVMKLHNALFEGQTAEQTAETVATAVKDAVDDAVDTAANEQVIQDVAETSSPKMSLEDQQDLKTLVESMSDNEQIAFLESLDDQQMQILMEGPWTWVKNLFTKAGRSANRLNKFTNLAKKDADLSSRLDKVMGIDPYLLSKKNAKKADKLIQKSNNIRTKMNDLKYKAASKSGKEYDEMINAGLNNGSRNFTAKELEAAKEKLVKSKDALTNEMNEKLSSIDTKYQENLTRLEERNRVSPYKDYNRRLNDVLKQRQDARAEVLNEYNPRINELNNSINGFDRNINLAQKEAAGFNSGVNFGGHPGRSQFGDRLYAERMNKKFGRTPAGMFVDEYGRPMWSTFARPGGLNSLINAIPVIGTINKARIGLWSMFTGALKLGTIGALGYGGYKIYDFFSKPEELDSVLGDDDGTTMENVKKVLYVLAGGAAGNVGARFLGFNSTTGKTVGTLLGAVLVAYFMFLNGGDEEKATELLDEYNNADEADQQAINEALQLDGLGEALQELYNAREGK